MARSAPLPLSEAPASGQASGLTRLKGAFFVAMDRLEPDPTQPRRTFDAAKHAEMIASVRERGVQQPIRVRYDLAAEKYRIIAGERRYRAAVELGMIEMPCIITDAEGIDERTVLIDQVVENWQRADLEPVELHQALVRLRDELGMTQNEIAQVMGKSKSEVSRFLSLGKVNPEILEAARTDVTGRFGRTTLEALAQVSSEDQRVLAKKVRAGSLLAKEVEQEARRLKQRSEGKRGGRASGTIRRIVIGNAIVTVQFRKHEVTSEELSAVLRRAVELVDRSELK